MDSIALVQRTFRAYAARNLAVALSGIHPDVTWDIGGDQLIRGVDAVAKYWKEQWRSVDARLLIRSIDRQGPSLVLNMTLHIRRRDGTAEVRLTRSVLSFENHLIASLRAGLKTDCNESQS